MTRYAPNEARPVAGKVALVDKYSSNMVSSWVDYIELRRTAAGTFSVWARKQFESWDTGRLRWGDWESCKGLKTPEEVLEAIELQADEFCVSLDWQEQIREISSIDWLTAAAIAKHRDLEIPELPSLEELLTQRTLRFLGSVVLGVEWAGEMHELTLPFDRWVRILNRQAQSENGTHTLQGSPQAAVWNFNNNRELQIRQVVGAAPDAELWSGPVRALPRISGTKVDDFVIAQLALEALDSLPDTNTRPVASR